ncbi:uncharacterized protein LOC101857224 [Aplysia californica]|uniref:Uncharacterized protein LOC101857224 n=1 Tax=Aplysia californica TaxID=6500 RepID=A0ABM1W2P8_APLCA|nr:uncharacterized protein LOC101857224 [Aplysia californica]
MMLSPQGQTSLIGHLYCCRKHVLFLLQIFLIFLPGSLAKDNCGWDRFVNMSEVSNFTLVSPNISNINLSSTEPCQITIFARGRPSDKTFWPSLFLFTKSFNLSGPGSCRDDSERVEISDNHRPPKKWCGRTFAEKLEFYKDVHLEYYPGTKDQGSGFEMVFQDWQWSPFCNGVQQLEVRDEPMLLYILRTGIGYHGQPDYGCAWNLTAPEDKIVLLRAFSEARIPCQGPWFEFGDGCQTVDFPKIKTQQTSTIVSSDDFSYYNSNYFLAEYVAASRDAIQCVDSTPVHVPLTTEELFIQLDSNTTRCTLQFTTDSPDKTVDLSFLPVVNDTSVLNVTGFILELFDGKDRFINSSDVNQQPFRRFQSAHSSVTLTYNKVEVEEGIRPSIFAWLRARARLPEQLPRNLRSTSVKSFLWVSAAYLSSPYSRLVKIYNYQKCLSLQVLDQTQTNTHNPADFFSAYADFKNSQYDLTYDCLGRPKEKMVLTEGELTSISFHRNIRFSGFWLVYNSLDTDEECKGLTTELTREGFEYTLPSDVFQRHSSCEFSMASNLSPGERVRFRVLYSESDLTLRSVAHMAGRRKFYTLLENGVWLPNKWVYSRYPLALTLKGGAHPSNGSSSFSFEVINTPAPGCGNLSLTATTVPQKLTSPYYPDFYPTEITCDWVIRKSSSVPANEHIVIEVPEYRKGCTYHLKESLDVTHIRDSGSNGETIKVFCQYLKRYQMFTDGYLRVRFVSDIQRVGPGFSLTYYTEERTSIEGCNQTVTLSENNTRHLLEHQFLPQHYTGSSYTCWWLFKSSFEENKTVVKNLSVQIPKALGAHKLKVIISKGFRGNELRRFSSPTDEKSDETLQVAPGTDLYVQMSMENDFREPMNISMEIETLKVTGCDGFDMTMDVGTEGQDFTSVDYPQLYKSDTECKWRLQAPEGKSVKVEVADLVLGGGSREDPCENYLSFQQVTPRVYFAKLCSDSEAKPFVIEDDLVILVFHTKSTGPGASFRLRLQAVDRSEKGDESGDDSGFKHYRTIGGVCAGVVGVIAIALGVYFVRQHRMRQQEQSQGNAATTVPHSATNYRYTKGSFPDPPPYALAVKSPASVTPQPGTKTSHW